MRVSRDAPKIVVGVRVSARPGKTNDAAPPAGIACRQLFSASHTGRLRTVVSFAIWATCRGLIADIRRPVEDELDLAEPGSAEVMVFAIRVEYAGLSPR